MNDLFWRVGKGVDVRLWRDKWIKGVESNLEQLVDVPEDKKDWRVSDIILNGSWAIRELQGIVPNDIICKIESMALKNGGKEDMVVWCGAKDGRYVVKKGYHRVRERRKKVCQKAGPSNILSKEVWGQVWKIKTLPKICHFIWRCLVKAVPVKSLLYKRRCSDTDACPVCGLESESIEHALFFCSWTRYVWFGSRLMLRVEMGNAGNMVEWWENFLLGKVGFNEYQLSYFVWVIWLIWKERNLLVFENKIPDPYKVIRLAGNAVDEFWKVKGWDVGDGRQKGRFGREVWRVPEEGMVKINCDGSFKEDRAAIGLVCRNNLGEFLWGFGETVDVEDAVIAELLAVKKVLVLLEEVDVEKIIIEMDCAEVFWCCKNLSAIGMDWRGRWEMQEVVKALEVLKNVEVSLVRRESNRAADWIAVNCGKEVCPFGWVLSPPLPLANILATDLCNSGSARAEDGAKEQEDARFNRCGIG